MFSKTICNQDRHVDSIHNKKLDIYKAHQTNTENAQYVDKYCFFVRSSIIFYAIQESRIWCKTWLFELCICKEKLTIITMSHLSHLPVCTLQLVWYAFWNSLTIHASKCTQHKHWNNLHRFMFKYDFQILILFNFRITWFTWFVLVNQQNLQSYNGVH